MYEVDESDLVLEIGGSCMSVKLDTMQALFHGQAKMGIRGLFQTSLLRSKADKWAEEQHISVSPRRKVHDETTAFTAADQAFSEDDVVNIWIDRATHIILNGETYHGHKSTSWVDGPNDGLRQSGQDPGDGSGYENSAGGR